MLYFAYGSNMSSRRLRAENRVPSARKVCVATLLGHRLAFHKESKDGSAKCDAYFTGEKTDRVIGVLFEISDSEKKALDRAEGLGFGYEEKVITVATESGERSAVAYFATAISSSLKPYDWYKRHVLAGAHENNLPSDYVKMIENVESIQDPDEHRKLRELAVYKEA